MKNKSKKTVREREKGKPLDCPFRYYVHVNGKEIIHDVWKGNTVNNIMKGRKQIQSEQKEKKKSFVYKKAAIIPAISSPFKSVELVSFPFIFPRLFPSVKISSVSLLSSLIYCRQLPVRASRLNFLQV